VNERLPYGEDEAARFCRGLGRNLGALGSPILRENQPCSQWWRDGHSADPGIRTMAISRAVDPNSPAVSGPRRGYFTSKRLAEDQLPGAPEAPLARARHHMVVTGSVLVLNWEAVTFWFTVSGAAKVFESSIWIV
jgi:hypothetical protein